MKKLTKVQLRAYEKHATAEYPKECVGVIADKKYKRLTNVSEDNDAFEVDYKELEAIDGVTALIHSHCFDVDSLERRKQRRMKIDGRTPSLADVKCQKQLDIPFGIAECNGEAISEVVFFGGEPQPLVGREFIFHINDCFTLVRDYYKQELDIDLVDRNDTEWNWWFNEDDPIGEYQRYYEQDGWEEVDVRVIEPNDVLLIQYRANVPNHIAIYKDSSTILHHMFGQYSCEAPLGQWIGYAVKVLRYVGNS